MEQYETHKGLVHTTAAAGYRRALRLGASVEFSDVYQEACEAFVNAAAGYDPSTGFAFSTYYTSCAWSQFRKMLKRDGLVAEKIAEDDADAKFGMRTRYVRKVSIVSAEAIMERADVEGDADFYALREDEVNHTPESSLEMRQNLDALASKLSPLAQAILRAWVQPGEELMAELQRVADHRAMVAGEPCERIGHPTLAELCQVMVAMGGSVRLIDQARREVLTMASAI